MICPNCNRLNDNSKIVCRFCGEVLKTEEYESLTLEQRQELAPKPEIKPEVAPVPKYRKTGWLFLLAVEAVAVVLIVLLCNAFSPSKNAVKDYAQAYYSADFELTAQESAVNLRKYYNANYSQNSIFDFFGYFNRYSSYEDMISQYSSAFNSKRQQVESICGSDYKVKVKIIREVKLHDAMMMRILSQYKNAYGDILRDGEIQEVRLVYAEISIIGEFDKTPQTVSFNVVKIDGKWCVLTDGTLNKY